VVNAGRTDPYHPCSRQNGYPRLKEGEAKSVLSPKVAKLVQYRCQLTENSAGLA
jgi:hypothetical protein